MKRLEDWPSRLASFVESRRERDFSWADNDCCRFVCDAVEAITGVDPGQRWRGLYSSEKSARRVLRDNGGVVGIATLVLGPAVPAALAQRGDVVLVDTPQGEALAVHLGNTVAAQGLHGIEFMSSGAAKAAWKV